MIVEFLWYTFLMHNTHLQDFYVLASVYTSVMYRQNQLIEIYVSLEPKAQVSMLGYGLKHCCRVEILLLSKCQQSWDFME